MKQENKRIFISDLPETCTSDELNASFSKYGQVSSVEIKERKELGLNNTSLFFAYVNLLTDDSGLAKCFRELSHTEWHGQYVQLKVARESFLERLKREREENKSNNDVKSNSTVVDVKSPIKSTLSQTDLQKKTNSKVDKKEKNQIVLKSKLEESTSESESDSDSDSEKNVKTETKHNAPTGESVPEVLPKIEYVIKNNKNKTFDKNLSIPSVGKEPIVKITTTKNVNKNDSDANLKRLESLKNMKNNYKAKMSSIKIALTYKDQKPNNKVIFDDDASLNFKANGQQKRSLFDGEDSDDAFEANFNHKPQFEGESGQKLLNLQSKYKNDKRFALDERFKEDESEEIPEEPESNLEEDIEAEKNVQMKILNEVLGKNSPMPVKRKKDSEIKKVMVRYDPMQPESKNLEVTSVEPPKKKKKNKKEEAVEETLPEVSKETFYKVTNDFKETLEEKQEFSLLNMFGKAKEDEDNILDQEHTIETEKVLKRNSLVPSRNPFKYDSSDDEDETEDIPHKADVNKASDHLQEEKNTRLSKPVVWRESFFFKNDDFRLQEGVDFIERIKTENKDFSKIRRDIKKIVKTKVKNNERKNKMFRKKLGGSKRRKHIRIKKALKR